MVEAIADVVQGAKDSESRVGFFAAMYSGVTLQVRAGVESDLFEDGARMERLATTFATRYLDAVNRFRSGDQPSRCWDFAFRSAEMWRPLILQHLLLGINAHINLDLGIAAALTSPGDDLPDLRNDFVEINRVLARQVDGIRETIGKLSPWIGLLDRVDPSAGRAIVNFSIERARDQAWTVAELLAGLPEERWPEHVDVLDRNALSLARLVRDPPGVILKAGLRIIRVRETNDVRRAIERLERPA
ncbi:MAG TPA: DUF5995 family protein [Acidimicrobiia bacterium]|nr:DUF5995 family protein [Acidimicrobiia bacterium]